MKAFKTIVLGSLVALLIVFILGLPAFVFRPGWFRPIRRAIDSLDTSVDRMACRFRNLCAERRYGEARELLEEYPEIVDYRLETPVRQNSLHILVAYNPGGIDIMLDAGADVNVLDTRGLTPLDYALRWGTVDVYRALAKRGGRFGPAMQDVDPWVALEKAQKGDVSFLQPVKELSPEDILEWVKKEHPGIKVRDESKAKP